jgi:DNA-binding Lrp family transcriptional regulator
MGRPPKEVDLEKLLDLSERGLSQKDLADELGISVPTLTKRLTELKEKQGLLLQYRELQSLQLTALQARILESITPEKIEAATLKELIGAFDILKKHERVAEGLPSDIKGLVGYLAELEKDEARERVRDITPERYSELDRLASGIWGSGEDLSEEDEDDPRVPTDLIPKL